MTATFDDAMGGEQAAAEAAGLSHETVGDAARPVVADAAAAAAAEDEDLDDGTPAELDRSRDPRVRQFIEGRAGNRLTELLEEQGLADRSRPAAAAAATDDEMTEDDEEKTT